MVIMPIARTGRWICTHWSHAWYNRQKLDLCGKSRKWAACIITTSGARRKLVLPKSPVFSCYEFSGLTMKRERCVR